MVFIIRWVFYIICVVEGLLYSIVICVFFFGEVLEIRLDIIVFCMYKNVCSVIYVNIYFMMF